MSVTWILLVTRSYYLATRHWCDSRDDSHRLSNWKLLTPSLGPAPCALDCGTLVEWTLSRAPPHGPNAMVHGPFVQPRLVKRLSSIVEPGVWDEDSSSERTYLV